uniref:ATP-dependent Clp protease ATP-binding subunit n=1 Tax=Nephromyces sp. ex Molgula occidentalis TaxID=2544991 RepID=A0A5C1H8U6_9APIC|nr:ATP-dependent Clp protease ATP-binding subunit [Nephromyces sp. ex Molgula occidentalis]
MLILNSIFTLNWTKEIFYILLKAEQLAVKYGNSYIEPIHILIAIYLTDNIFSYFFKIESYNQNFYEKILIKTSVSNFTNYTKIKYFSISSLYILNKAFKTYKFLNSLELVSILISERDFLISTFLDNLNITKDNILNIINKYIKIKTINDTNILNKYTYSISNSILKTPLIYREKEITNIIEILSKNLKNNPILVGEIGIGRFSILSSLIQKINQKQVPLHLQNKEIKILNLSSFLKNSQYKGDLEEQFEKIIKASKKQGNLILACLDIHYLFNLFNQQSTSDQDNVSSLNIFKKAFKEKDIQLIGITTPKEYLKQIKINPMIEQIFEKIIINEPSLKETFNILTISSKTLENFHSIKITPNIIKETISLSQKFLKNKTFPLKGLEVLDLAALKTKQNIFKFKSYKNYIQNIDLYKAISQLSGLPEDIISQNNQINQNIKNLKNKLNQNIYGQNTAIETISNTIKSAYLGLKQSNKPIGSWVLWGPSGTGKTELAKTITKILFGTEKKIIRFDMSEFMEKHSLSRLIGSPPGYIGYGEGGQLTEAVAKNPYCVLLFDEIEKAHEDINNLMLQILDDGRLTDSTGKQIDFSNTIILFTSNLGWPKNFSELKFIKNQTYDSYLETQIHQAITTHFKPEFINRLTEIIIFKPLSIETLTIIASKFLNQLQLKLIENNLLISLSVHYNVKVFLSKISYNPIYGARPLKRLIEKLIETPISDLIIKFKFTTPHIISFLFEESSKKLIYSIKKSN